MPVTDILELRILPALAVARLGSSPSPLDNYECEVDREDPLDYRRLKPAPTLTVDEATGAVTSFTAPPTLRFRDADGRIRPVAPFLEVWAQFEVNGPLAPLTLGHLRDVGLGPEHLRWSVHVGNIKAARRTGDTDDRIEARVGPFSDHERHELQGECANFKPGRSLFLGSVRFIRPTDEFPQIRLRFTPAGGKVYGAERDGVVEDRDVYDASRGTWKGYFDTGDPRETVPGAIYASESDAQGNPISKGYLDDECDGIVEVTLEVPAPAGGAPKTLGAFARVTAGPPTFAPDARPVRAVGDELEQALLGPEVTGPVSRDEVEAIVRRALESVRLMNTEVLNRPAQGMARMDTGDVRRAAEPIMDPAVVDALAIRSRHERVLLALESGMLAWFARVLRDYDQIGDLSDAGRRKMPAMMRGAEGRHLALSRRQVNKVRAAAQATPSPAEAPPQAEGDVISPVNLTAQLAYRGAGNPPSTHPNSAISNAFPGLEMDFRNAWKHVLEGIELHEASNLVVRVEPDADDEVKQLANGFFLLAIDKEPVTVEVRGPKSAGAEVVRLPVEGAPDGNQALEWSNVLAAVLARRAGQRVDCLFQSKTGDRQVHLALRIRPFFERQTRDDGSIVQQAVIARELVHPGGLTQSLCSPWQNDYRECACFYWAASRPDFVNVEPRPDGTAAGNNWMQKDRTPQTPRVYVVDDRRDERLITYVDLFQDWERQLRFEIRGEDAE